MKFSIDKGNDQRKYRLSLIKIQPNSLTYDKTEKKMKYVLMFECETHNRDTIHTTALILILIFFLFGRKPTRL